MEICPICRCLLAGLPLETATKLCEVSDKYPYPSIDMLIRLVQGPANPLNLYGVISDDLIREHRLKLAWRKFILDLADELRLTIFVKWLNDKLTKLNQWWNRNHKFNCNF